jgi:cholinesterase
MKLKVFTHFVIRATCGLALQSIWKIRQQVSTSSGKVIGGRASTGSEVSGYFGIPFAKPPIGDLRFAPPERIEGNGITNATSFASKTLFCSSTI